METLHVWTIVAVICVLLEFVIPGAIISFVGLAAGIVAIGIHFGWIESTLTAINTFLVSSIFLLLVVRTLFLRLFPGDIVIDNVEEDEEAIGAIVEVILDISPDKPGRIRYRQSTWDGMSTDVIKQGEKAKIISRSGQCWIVQLPTKGSDQT